MELALLFRSFELHINYTRCVALGGLVVSVLATGPIPTEGDGFLRVIKIRRSKAVGPMS
jgi:hypothetical protein